MDDQLATDDDLDLSVPRRAKFGVALLVIAIQVLLVLGLIRAFTPHFAAKMLDTVVSTFTVTVTTPPPAPPPPPPPPAAKAPEPPGKSGSEGKRAVAKPIIAKARVPVKSAPAPLATNTGSAVTSGSGTKGNGTGAGGPGSGSGSGAGGTGSGAGGTGQGGGGAVTKAVKIAGEINSARDYPIATRDLRINDYVIVAVSVGADGRPTGCRVSRASKDAQANTVTCQLALTRFRFKPATDAGGKPVASVYGWKQSWFY